MNEQEKNQQVAPETDDVTTEERESDDIEVVTDDDGATPEQEVSDPAQQVEQLKNELAAEREKYLRALADMDNLRKRCRRDVEEARTNGRMNVLEELLPSLDSIDMALKSIEPNEANQGVFDGMVMVQRQFMASMERFELKPVQSKGQKFDPSIHEAVSYVPSADHEAGEIIEEMRAGYTLGTRLLRAAMVVVSAGKPAEPVDKNAGDVVSSDTGDDEVVETEDTTVNDDTAVGEDS